MYTKETSLLVYMTRLDAVASSHRRIVNDVRRPTLKFAFTGTYWRVRQASLLFPHSRSGLSATTSQSISLTGSLKSL